MSEMSEQLIDNDEEETSVPDTLCPPSQHTEQDGELGGIPILPSLLLHPLGQQTGMKVSPSVESIDLGSDVATPGEGIEISTIEEEEHVDKVQFQIAEDTDKCEPETSDSVPADHASAMKQDSVPSLSNYFCSEQISGSHSAAEFFDSISTDKSDSFDGNKTSKVIPDAQKRTGGLTEQINDETTVEHLESLSLNETSETVVDSFAQDDAPSLKRIDTFVEAQIEGVTAGDIVSEEQTTKQLFEQDDVKEDVGEQTALFETFTAGDIDAPDPSVNSPRTSRGSSFIESTEIQSTQGLIIDIPSSPISTSPFGSVSPSVSYLSSQPLASISPTTSDMKFMTGLTEDPFTLSLSTSDSDRRHDAWLPSEMTRQTLISMATCQPGTFNIEPTMLTLPSIMVDDPQGDPIRDLLYKYMGELEAMKRQVLSVDSVPQDENGLRLLIATECYRSAIDLTGRLLTTYGQGLGSSGQLSKHTPWSLQIWFVRISLLVKLRQYSVADSECLAFGNMDRPDLYYEFYPDLYRGRQGSMVPFEFRVIHAELPQFLGKPQEALDRLYYVKSMATKITSNLSNGLSEEGSMTSLPEDSRQLSLSLWQQREIRVLYSISSCLLSIKDYELTLQVLEGLMEKDQPRQAAILCSMGRITLQMGDVNKARDHFDRYKNLSNGSESAQCKHLMNMGFVSLSEGHFEQASQYFKQVIDLDPKNALAVNNLSVCLLYMGRLKDAIHTLEVLIHSDPQTHVQEGVCYNICTLYELQSSRALHMKQSLLDLVSKHKGNGFNVASLKMP